MDQDGARSDRANAAWRWGLEAGRAERQAVEEVVAKAPGGLTEPAASGSAQDVAFRPSLEPLGVGLREAPRHVAIIMDGNGRWAKSRGLPRIAGHERGASSVRSVVEACPDLGVRYLTIYAFSTENWRRPADEVSGLMGLFRLHLRREGERLHRNGVRVRFIGDPAPLDPDLRRLMTDLSARTAENTRLTFSIAINYGARAEIVTAARRLAAAAVSGEVSPEEIDELAIDAQLSTVDLPDPDLLIRTSGEQRLSNFMLWQAAYAELLFAPQPWPEFDGRALGAAVDAYRRRERRFGAVSG